MLDNFDAVKLDQLIRDEDGFWSWSLFGGKYYVTNRCLAFVIDKDEAEEDTDAWELLECLEHHFKKVPNECTTLILQHGDITERTDQKIVDTLKNQFAKKSKNCGKVTPFIYAKDFYRYRWTRFPDFNLFIQDQYISILYNAVDEDIFADGPVSPAFLCDGQFMILPIKNMDNKVDDSFYDFEKLIRSDNRL